MSGEIHCPLCAGEEISEYCQDRQRPYLACGNCALVFVPPSHYLSRIKERREYDLHQNDIHNSGYQKFLSRIARPLVERVPAGASGLDFGCGPGPALAHMLRGAGYEVALYDSFYAPDRAALQGHYDFVCATEVVEHLHQPGRELAQLWSLLPVGGLLAVMTKLVRDPVAFASWHYKNDPTHVCFFSAATWRWWAAQCGASVEIVGADVIFLRKKSQATSANILA